VRRDCQRAANIFFTVRFGVREKIFFATRVGRNLNAIMMFARDDEDSSTSFPEVWRRPL
jgi:hypothetical protein